MKKSRLAVFFTLMLLANFALAACSPLNWKALDRGSNTEFETANPGFFDVGIGYAHIPNVATKTTNRAANGLMATIKAYPCGRWYAPRSKSNETDVIKKLVAATVLQHKAGVADNEKTASEADAENALKGYLNQSDLYPLIGEDWEDRLSVFYGRSMGNFDSDAIDGPINVVGVGFDVVPEFALILGAAFLQPAGTTSNKTQYIFGVQMNLNAFQTMRSFVD